MPNWVTNQINLTGTNQNLKRFAEAVEGGGNEFNFNKIIPMPESLNITAGGMQEEAIMACLTNNCSIELDDNEILKFKLVKYGVKNMFCDTDEWHKKVFERTKEMLSKDGPDKKYSFGVSLHPSENKEMTLKEAGMIYCSNFDLYGSVNWYDWCCDNWGTKWNACDVFCEWLSDYELSYTFNTAWSAPYGVFEKIAEDYPDISFEVLYADEDIGSNCGTITFNSNGDPELVYWEPNNRKSAVAFALEVRGYEGDDIEDYFDEDEDEDEDKAEEVLLPPETACISSEKILAISSVYPYMSFGIQDNNGGFKEIKPDNYGVDRDGTIWFYDEVTAEKHACPGTLMMWKGEWSPANIDVMFEIAESMPDKAEWWTVDSTAQGS